MRKRIAVLLLLLSIPAAALERQSTADYQARRQKLAERAQGGAALVFAAMEAEGQNATWGFRQNDDFYYLTGWAEPGAALLVAPATDSHPYTEILFLPAHNLTQEKWTGPKLGAEDGKAPEITGVAQVEVLDRLRDELVRVLPSPRATVYTDLPGFGQSSPSAPGPIEYLRRSNAFPNYASFQDVKPLVAALRVVKDAGELKLIGHATDASVAAHLAAMRAIRPGMNEHDISALMQYEFQKRGCERPAYAPIVGAGFNSTVLHYSADSGPIGDGDMVLMDVAGEFGMYASDITRTVPASGHFSARQREIYEIVLGAEQAAIAAFQAGKSTIARSGPGSLHQVAYDYINTHGADKHGQPLGKYFIHGLSHFVGLEVHDVGDSAQPLQPGMVFTIEPGIYLPEEKLGVRIEDTFAVGADGKLINLSGALPHTADEVEKAMAAAR